jgi:indolepyruvate ferredoxin oxidoreductase
MTAHDVSLDDKFDLTKERIFVTGSQAVVRLLMMQQERDRRAGLNTAGFVSGYRGSPLGGLDQQILRAQRSASKPQYRFPARAERGAGRDSLLGNAAVRPGWNRQI